MCVCVFRRFGFAICAVGFPLNLAKCAPFHIEHHQPAINTRDELLEDAERFHMQANAYALEIPLIAALLVLQALSENLLAPAGGLFVYKYELRLNAPTRRRHTLQF